METSDSEPRAIMCERMPCRSYVDCECAGWPASPIEHARLCRKGQGLKRSGGSEHWPSGPWGGWFPHWVSLFLANNRDLIWLGWGGGEGVSKASMTPLLHSHRFPAAALRESSHCSMLLCAKAMSSCDLATHLLYLDRVKQRIILLVSETSKGLV